MKEIEIKKLADVPDNFTGVAHRSNSKQWYKNGVLHREDGPAIVYYDGAEEWFQNDVYHRTNGPAVIFGKYQVWYFRGRINRLNGPAAYNIGEMETAEYWINSLIYSKEEFDKKVQLIPYIEQKREKYKHLTDDQWQDYLLNVWVV